MRKMYDGECNNLDCVNEGVIFDVCEEDGELVGALCKACGSLLKQVVEKTD